MASNQLGFPVALTSAAVSLAVCAAFGIGFFVGSDVGAAAERVRSSEEQFGPASHDKDLNPSAADTTYDAEGSLVGNGPEHDVHSGDTQSGDTQSGDTQADGVHLEEGSGRTADGCAVHGEEPYVCVERANVSGDDVVVRLRYVGFEPSIGSGMHAHVYRAGGGDGSAAVDRTLPGNLTIEGIDLGQRETASMGAHGDASVGGGRWWVADSTSLRIPLAQFLKGANEEEQRICVATATPRHTLLSLAESCVFLT